MQTEIFKNILEAKIHYLHFIKMTNNLLNFHYDQAILGGEVKDMSV